MLVDFTYFTNDYLGVGVAEADFPRIEMRAEEAVDNLTRGALENFNSMPSAVQGLVKKAICAQVEYYGAYSTEVGFKAEDEGFTVGKVSVSGSSESGDGFGSKKFYSPRAISFLERAGLLGRNVGVLC